jgi:hypothetical protein
VGAHQNYRQGRRPLRFLFYQRGETAYCGPAWDQYDLYAQLFCQHGVTIEIWERGLLLSTFLQYVVRVDEKNAEKDAGKLEYIISEETMEKVKRMLPVCNAHKNIRNLPHIQNISARQRSI